MNIKKIHLQQLLLGILSFCVIVLSIMTVIQEKTLQKQRILFADEVGLTDVINQEIVSARFDSLIPTYIYDCTDLSVIPTLLDAISDAVFRVAQKPSKVIFSL